MNPLDDLLKGLKGSMKEKYNEAFGMLNDNDQKEAQKKIDKMLNEHLGKDVNFDQMVKSIFNK